MGALDNARGVAHPTRRMGSSGRRDVGGAAGGWVARALRQLVDGVTTWPGTASTSRGASRLRPAVAWNGALVQLAADRSGLAIGVGRQTQMQIEGKYRPQSAPRRAGCPLNSRAGGACRIVVGNPVTTRHRARNRCHGRLTPQFRFSRIGALLSVRAAQRAAALGPGAVRAPQASSRGGTVLDARARQRIHGALTSLGPIRHTSACSTIVSAQGLYPPLTRHDRPISRPVAQRAPAGMPAATEADDSARGAYSHNCRSPRRRARGRRAGHHVRALNARRQLRA